MSPSTACPLLALGVLCLVACRGIDEDGGAPASSDTGAATADPPGGSATAAVASAVPAVACEPACLDIERCEAGRCVPACPAGEVYVPATGPQGFTMGAGLRGAVDTPHKVVLTRPFCMDAVEVTVKAYTVCVEAKRCEAPRTWGLWINYGNRPDHPVNKVHFRQARTYCQSRGQDLPTEAQWEWAASGGDGRKWPWGDDYPTCKHADFTDGVLPSPSGDAGCHGGGTSAVGSHPLGAKRWPSGDIHDLGGNVWEWVLDNFKPFTYAEATDPLVTTFEADGHVNRGGGWNRSAMGIRIHFRGVSAVDYQVPGLGFRCVRNPTTG